jgi:hypothetical protein
MKCKDYQDQKKARKVKQADRETRRAIGQKVRPRKRLSDWIALDQQAISRAVYWGGAR